MPPTAIEQTPAVHEPPVTRPRCLAIVPAFNEEHAIAHVVTDLLQLEGVDVIVVDDGSSDRTAEIAREAGARVASLPFNLGIGGAVQTGYLAALEGEYDVAIQVDGDGQHPAGAIPDLVARLGQGDADLVVGSRFLSEGGYRSTATRRAGIAVFSSVVSAVTRTRLSDTTSGFRAAGPRCIRLFAESYPHDYPEVESLVVAARAGLEIAEIPVEMRERQGGRSSITPLRSLYYMIKVLLAVMMATLRRSPGVPGEKTP